MAKRNQNKLFKRNHDAYKGNNSGTFVKIKFAEEDHTDGFYILLISGAMICGAGKDQYFIPADAQKILRREKMRYVVLK